MDNNFESKVKEIALKETKNFASKSIVFIVIIAFSFYNDFNTYKSNIDLYFSWYFRLIVVQNIIFFGSLYYDTIKLKMNLQSNKSDIEIYENKAAIFVKNNIKISNLLFVGYLIVNSFSVILSRQTVNLKVIYIGLFSFVIILLGSWMQYFC